MRERRQNSRKCRCFPRTGRVYGLHIDADNAVPNFIFKTSVWFLTRTVGPVIGGEEAPKPPDWARGAPLTDRRDISVRQPDRPTLLSLVAALLDPHSSAIVTVMHVRDATLQRARRL